MANWIGDFDSNSRIDFDVTTVGLDGLPTALTSGSACVKRTGASPPSVSGPVLAWAGVSALTASGGLLSGTVFTASAASYFTAGMYSVFLGAGSVTTTSAIGYAIAQFRIGGLIGITDILSDSVPLGGANLNSLTTRIPAALTTSGQIKADTQYISGILQTGRDLGTSVTADSVTGNIGGNLGGTLTSTERNAIADATMARTLGTESYAADGAVPTLAQAMFMLMSKEYEMSLSGTTMTCKKLDGTTTSMTFTLDDATAPTSITRTT